MFNILLALSIGIIIGWNFNAFFQALDAPNIIRSDIDLTKSIKKEPLLSYQKEKEDIKEKPLIVKENSPKTLESNRSKKDISKKDTPKKPSFYTLLHNNLFSDALALYIDAKNKNIAFYRATIEEYFKKNMKKNSEENIFQMVEFLEVEAENREVRLLLAEEYKNIQAYQESILIISELLDSSSADEVDRLNLKLTNTTKLYIDKLHREKNPKELITFLTNQVDEGLNVGFFTITLAKEYIFLKKYALASKILKEIEFDDIYGDEAKELLENIKTGKVKKDEYSFTLPLNKVGEHFTIDVTVEGSEFTLLLDTGASLSMIDEDKIPSLRVLNENLTLKTAGGEVQAELRIAEIFKVGEIELKNFKIISSLFKEDYADGLLGMNFFKAFKFKIDQEKHLLYLAKKEEKSNKLSLNQ